MGGNRKRLYYRLTPIFERSPTDPPTIASAAIVTCMATGKMLAGRGGGSEALSPEIVDQLDMRKTGGVPRVICDAATFDGAVEALREAEQQIVYLHEKFAATGSGEAALSKIRTALSKAEAR